MLHNGYIKLDTLLDKYEKSEVVKNFDRLNKLKFSTVEPTAFTQRGLYMLATIIKSPRISKHNGKASGDTRWCCED